MNTETNKRNMSLLSQFDLPEIDGLNPELVVDAIYGVYPGIYNNVYTAHLTFVGAQGATPQSSSSPGASASFQESLLSDQELTLISQETIRCGANLAFVMSKFDWKTLFQGFSGDISSGQTQRRSA